MHITQYEKGLNIYSADCYYSYCGTKCMTLIYGSALKEFTVLFLVYYMLAASVANMCGRVQLLFHSDHVFVIGVKQNDAVTPRISTTTFQLLAIYRLQ
jgi:hypothetical protein